MSSRHSATMALPTTTYEPSGSLRTSKRSLAKGVSTGFQVPPSKLKTPTCFLVADGGLWGDDAEGAEFN